MATSPRPSPSLEGALLAPARALVEAERALSSEALRTFESGLRDRGDGVHEMIRLPMEVPRGPSPAVRLEPPVLALRPAANLRIEAAEVGMAFAISGTAARPAAAGEPVAKGPPLLIGAPSARRAHARRSDPSLRVEIQMTLRRAGPTEGAARVEQRLLVRGLRPCDRDADPPDPGAAPETA